MPLELGDTVRLVCCDFLFEVLARIDGAVGTKHSRTELLDGIGRGVDVDEGVA